MLGFSALLSVVAGPILAIYLSAIGSVAGPQWRYIYHVLLERVSEQGLSDWNMLTAGFARLLCTVVVFIVLSVIGQKAIRIFENASQIVADHHIHFYQWRTIVKTPGTVLDYFIWAYIYSTLAVFIPLAINCTFIVLIPLSL